MSIVVKKNSENTLAKKLAHGDEVDLCFGQHNHTTWYDVILKCLNGRSLTHCHWLEAEINLQVSLEFSHGLFKLVSLLVEEKHHRDNDVVLAVPGHGEQRSRVAARSLVMI